jgi:tetratricopeptide (TPR) repeat protein
MTALQTEALEVFCSYDHEDELLWKRLAQQLRVLEEHGLISAWHCGALRAGQNWQREIEQHLQSAQLILLLISPAFMASERCYRIEMIEAMKRHEAGEARVIPIILRPVYWQNEPFSKLQVLPTGGKPVKSWRQRDEAFADIAMGIQKIAQELLVGRLLRETERLYKTQQHEEALSMCERALRLGFESAVLYWRKGNILLSCQEYEQALAAYQEALRLDPTLADPYFYQNKGHACRHLKRYEEALAAYERAIHLSLPDPNPRLYYLKGDVLKQLAEQTYEMAQQYSQGGDDGTVSHSS